MNPENKVDLTNPELSIIVEVIKSVCCLSVVRNYALYRKYNLQEVVKEDAAPKPDPSAAGDAEATQKATGQSGGGEDILKAKEEEEEQTEKQAEDIKEPGNGKPVVEEVQAEQAK